MADYLLKAPLWVLFHLGLPLRCTDLVAMEAGGLNKLLEYMGYILLYRLCHEMVSCLLALLNFNACRLRRVLLACAC